MFYPAAWSKLSRRQFTRSTLRRNVPPLRLCIWGEGRRRKLRPPSYNTIHTRVRGIDAHTTTRVRIGPRAVRDRLQPNTLRFLATDLRISLVCAGTHDAKRALTTDPQLADRFEAIELPPWKNNESLHRLLTSFQSLLPLRVRSDLVAPAMRRALLERTEGITVRLVRLIETLAVDAIRNHTEKIDATSLHRLSTPPFLSMTESHSASDTSP